MTPRTTHRLMHDYANAENVRFLGCDGSLWNTSGGTRIAHAGRSIEVGDTWDTAAIRFAMGQRVTNGGTLGDGTVTADNHFDQYAVELEWDADEDGGPYEDEYPAEYLRALS